MTSLKLSEIWVYPIKSLGGIRLTKSLVLEKGLQYDRRWMLVDESGTFMTQRLLPQMALFKIELENGQFTITHSLKKSFHSIAAHPESTGTFQSVSIWDDTVKAFEVSEASSAWFTDMLNIQCKLMYFPEENERPVDRIFSSHEHVSLADGYPFLIIGETSLDDLNNRMIKALPMNRFRPNFVFTGGLPYEEDRWKEFSIGNNRFLGVKPCSRCVLTTINQETGEKSDEPLRTLATYRKQNNKIYFGQNLLAVDHTFVQEGDLINVHAYD